MNSSGNAHLARYRAAAGALAELPTEVAVFRELDDAVLLQLQELQTAATLMLEASEALIAGEIAYRSRPSLGNEGMAQRTGHRTPEQFIKQMTGATRQQITTAIKAGTLLGEIADEGRVDEITGEVAAPTRPWLRPVAIAVAAGRISTSAAESIGNGLGVPTSAVSAEELEVAASILVTEALARVDADRLFRRARELRDELDVAGVKLREAEQFQLRDLKVFARADGGGRAVWNMDAETFARVRELFDRATSPKRGGVRFVGRQAAVAEAIAADERTPGQLASDVFLQLLSQGADADSGSLLGSGAPVIRVTVTEHALKTGVGVGRIEGQPQPVSVDTVNRLLCEGTSIRMGFDPAGNVLDLEREHRLFSRRQREVLSVKFGGCMDPACDRPPSWCEAHHIDHVARDGGKTEIRNGILLCRWHHLKYHNEGWEISSDASGQYWLVPPATIDASQTPRPMPVNTPAMRDLTRHTG
jgi:hypothetical protein